MKTLLVGNGINIQFGGEEYSNSAIIERAINNVKTGNFRETDYPADIVEHLQTLFEFAIKIIADKSRVENKVWTNEDEIALDNFCKRHTTLPNFPSKIGFEDYFLIQRILFNYTYDANVGNYREREQYYERLRRFFLDAIYNDGKINEIVYPNNLTSWSEQFGQVYSLNYDSNLENLGLDNILHLHGAFATIAEKYNNESPMNKAMRIRTNIEGHEHLYSTALMSYDGHEKDELLVQADRINQVFKYANAMRKETKQKGISLNPQLQRIFDAYEKNPNYRYPQNYCYDEFQRINGELTILGMSPSNDEHIIKVVNSNIDVLVYYFYPSKNSKYEKERVKSIFAGKTIKFENARKLWDSLI